MKKKYYTLLIALSVTITSNGAQLMVQENGPSGTYASIQGAINAASSGDEIIVFNRAGGIPWVGDLTINKSLTIRNAEAAVRFKYQGDLQVTYVANAEISIVGMENSSGRIYPSGSGTNSQRTKVNVFGSILGMIDFHFYENFTLSVYNTIVDTDINLVNGSVVGSECKRIQIEESIGTNTQSSANIFIVGNKLVTTGFTNIYVMCPAYNIDTLIIQNNFMHTEHIGVFLDDLTPGTYIDISNNSIIGSNSATDGMYIREASCIGLVLNNAIQGYYSDPTLDNNSSSLYFGYNYYNDDDLFGIVNDGTNNVSSFTLFDEPLQNTSPLFNVGNPANQYLDVDLTRNDAGAYGGSYARTNFTPIDSIQKPVVSFVKANRVVNFGEDLSINSIGYSYAGNIVEAEYFWNTDPGQGNGSTLSALDGGIDEAVEKFQNAIQTWGLMQNKNVLHIRVKDEQGNWSNTFKVVVFVQGLTTSIDLLQEKDLKIYPNPSVDFIRLNKPIEVLEVKVYDSFGRLFQVLDKQASAWDISSYPAGVYYVNMLTANYKQVTLPFIKK